MSYKTTIDIIRHGEPVGGVRYRGHGVDDPLTERGWEQMWSAVEHPPAWSRIITSPLKRCYEFALALSEKQGLPLSVEERVKEVGFGDWEGKTKASVLADDPEALRRFYANPVNERPKRAEPLETFFARVREALESAFHAYGGEHILIVSHAGVIRSAISMALQGRLESLYAVNVEYANMTRIAYSSDYGLHLISHGNVRACE